MSTAKKHTVGERLRRERERLNWSQEELAQNIGTTALSINRWEHDKTFPRGYYRTQLCRIFNMSFEALFDLNEGEQDETLALPANWNVPYLRNLYFTGRQNILEFLYQTLSIRKTVALTQPYAMSGLGGIGKTQTAVEYAYRYGAEYNAVLWAKADSYESLVSDFVTFAYLLELPEKDSADQSRLLNTVKRWMQKHAQWLLILDNADDLQMIYDFLPARTEGHILLTTRSQATGPYIKGIELDKMNREEGTLFLLRRAKLIAEDAPLESASHRDQSEAEAIYELLDGLPLALDQAAAYIEENGCSFADYFSLYQVRRAELLRRRGNLSSRDYPKSVATTWSLSFEQVQQTDPLAADLLRLCAFLHPDAIPEAMILEGAAGLGPTLQPLAGDPMRLDEAIGVLRRYSLVRRNPETKTLTIHRLVQIVHKDSMPQALQREWAEQAVRAVNAAFPEAELAATWSQCQQYLPHAQICAELIDQWGIMLSEAARLLHRSGNYLHERGQFAQVELLYRRALTIRERLFGRDHPEVAATLNDLAMLYFAQGKYDRSNLLYQQTLAIREQVFGRDHPEVAITLNNLAMLYFAQGEYGQVESLYQRAISIFECAPQSTYFSVCLATSLNNLARLYIAQCNYELAEVFIQRALDIREEVLEANNPDIANSLENLATLKVAQSKYSEAELLYLRALSIREQAFGPTDLNIIGDLYYLAKIYHNQGRYSEARPLFQRALTIRQQNPGYSDPDLATVLEDYAALLRKMGRVGKAASLEERAKAIRTGLAQDTTVT